MEMERLQRIAKTLAAHGQQDIAAEIAQVSLAIKSANESIPKGTMFEVVMKHGDWWSEMRKGVVLEAAEDGQYGKPLAIKHAGWAQGNFSMLPTKEGAKIKLTSSGPFKRALTVRIVERTGQ
jgi:hypothetical protein